MLQDKLEYAYGTMDVNKCREQSRYERSLRTQINAKEIPIKLTS